jgi:hypothetical protein
VFGNAIENQGKCVVHKELQKIEFANPIYVRIGFKRMDIAGSVCEFMSARVQKIILIGQELEVI